VAIAQVVGTRLIPAAGVATAPARKAFEEFGAATLTVWLPRERCTRIPSRADLDGAAAMLAIAGVIVGSAMLAVDPKPNQRARDRMTRAAVDLMFNGPDRAVSSANRPEPKAANIFNGQPAYARLGSWREWPTSSSGPGNR
jgi:hypothetical protein